jgi:hypothetical protein
MKNLMLAASNPNSSMGGTSIDSERRYSVFMHTLTFSDPQNLDEVSLRLSQLTGTTGLEAA